VFITDSINDNAYIDIHQLADRLGHRVDADENSATYIIDFHSFKFVESSFYVVYKAIDSVRIIQMSTTPFKKNKTFHIPIVSFFKVINEMGLADCDFHKNRITIRQFFPTNFEYQDSSIIEHKTEFDDEQLFEIESRMPLDTVNIAPTNYIIPEGLKKPR